MKSKNSRDSARLPLTDRQLDVLRPSDLKQRRLTNEEMARLKKINEARRQEQAQRFARLRAEQAVLLADLRKAGCNIESIWDLVNTSERYPEAIPILLRHLRLPYSDRTLEGIARSLAVPEVAVSNAWPDLVEAYRKAPMGKGPIAPGETREYELGAKDGLACALAASVTDDRLTDLIALANDRSLGDSRLLLLSALRKRRRKNKQAEQAIAELASDPALGKEIASWGKR